jgi:long-chain acyl-CoA synthetase
LSNLSFAILYQVQNIALPNITPMNKGTRLFDCLTAQAKEPMAGLLNSKVDGSWKPYSTGEVHEMVYQLAQALMDMGVSAGDGTVEGRDKIGLISAGRPEWLIVDLAVQLTGAVLVPLYPNTSTREIEQILNEADVKYIFVSNKELYDKVSLVNINVPSLKTVFSFDAVSGSTNWATLLKPLQPGYQQRLTEISDKITEGDIATIIYTSGTTGRPKGVMLSHKNILSNVMGTVDLILQIPVAQKRAFSFLPLNHIFEKAAAYTYFFCGYAIYFAENMDTIGANMKEVKPYIFTAVPRLLEKIFERITAEGLKLSGIKRKIFLWSIKIAGQFEIENKGPIYKIKLAIADKLVYSKWRNAVGGNIKAIVLGSSACPVRLEKIFTAAGMVTLEGYGLTETSPAISLNHYAKSGRKFGTVGPLMVDVQVKIAADGEILCKGPNVMAGYYKNPELTAEVMEGGCFTPGT